jgi:peptide deformylase
LREAIAMPVRPVVLYPDPVLLTPTRPVVTVDEHVRALVRDLVESMYAAPGIGLAANQLGESLRVCVLDPSGGEEPGALRILINPAVLHTEGSEVAEEGCLSFPDITLEIERPHRARVEAMDLEGMKFSVDGEGLLARVMLHEIEHLNGQVFIQNISSLRREIVKREIRKRIKAGEWVSSALR